MVDSIKVINIQEKTYSYIDYNNGKDNGKDNSVRGIIVDVNPDVREKLEDTGGFYGQLLEPIITDKKNQIKKLVMLSLTGKGMGVITGFYYTGDDDFKTIDMYTTEPSIPKFMTDKLIKEGVDVQVINTLAYLKENPDCDFNRYLRDYYSPKTIDDTGLYLGAKMIDYNIKLEVVDVEGLIKEFNLKHSTIAILKPARIIIKVNPNGPGMYNTIGSMRFERDGKLITYMENYYMNEIYGEGGNTKESDIEGFKAYIENSKINTIHEYALRINKTLSPRRDHMDLERIINRYNERIDIEITSIEGESHVELLDLDMFCAMLKKGFVQEIREVSSV